MAYTSPYRAAAEIDERKAEEYRMMAEEDGRARQEEEERLKVQAQEKADREKEDIQRRADRQKEAIESGGTTGSGVLDVILGR